MTPVHVHLILNHVPILLVPLGMVILAYATWRELEEVKKVALGLLVLCGLIVWPVYLSGEPSEESVEHLPQVSESLIESHEDAGKLALILTEVIAFASAFAMFYYRRRDSSRLTMFPLLALALAASLVLAWTGFLGGQIRHSEIRSAAGATAPAEHD